MAPVKEKRKEEMCITRGTSRRNLSANVGSPTNSSSLGVEKIDLITNTKDGSRQKGKKITVKTKRYIKPKVPRTNLFHSTPLVKNHSEALPKISTIHKNCNSAPFDPKQRQTISANRYTEDTNRPVENLFNCRRQTDVYDKPRKSIGKHSRFEVLDQHQDIMLVRKLSDPHSLSSASCTKKISIDPKERKLCEIFRKSFMPKPMNAEPNCPKSTPQSGVALTPCFFDNKTTIERAPEKEAKKKTKKRVHKEFEDNSKNMHQEDKENQELNLCKPAPEKEAQKKTKTRVDKELEDNSKNMHQEDKENQELNLCKPQAQLDLEEDNNCGIESGKLNESIDILLNTNAELKRRLSKHYLDSDTFCLVKENEVEMFQWVSKNLELEPVGEIRINETLSNSILKSGFIEINVGGKKNYSMPKLHNINFIVFRGSAEVKVHTCVNNFTRGQAFYVPKDVLYEITNIGDEKLLLEYVKILAKD